MNTTTSGNVGGTSGNTFDSADDIRVALVFLHEMGHLLYFANLSSAVVLDPAWLCDLLLRLLLIPPHPGAASTRAGKVHQIVTVFEGGC